jgi:transcriptional regulator with GAF, ATPase, and Fis domain
MRSAQRIAKSKGTVLITGESGTGKERVAQVIHQESSRARGPFIRVNCAALSETLLESELFGHERGAFTGAHKSREGRFELADGGTLLLDEIGEISPALQAKLLRVLEEEEFERVGGNTTIKVDVRVVATTNRDLATEVKAGRFREDLYYRLHVLPIHVTPLRERAKDIVPLTKHFLAHYARSQGQPIPQITPAAEQRLMSWSWPGNVRELENVVQRAVVLMQGNTLDAPDLVFGAATGPVAVLQGGAPAAQSTKPMLANRPLADIEREAILETLASTGGNKTEAARRMGVSARTLSNKMKLWRQLGLVA